MLSFDKETVNLGNVKHKQVATGTVNVTNLNAVELRPHAPASSCACTTGYFNPNVIAPNGKSVLTINFNSGKVGLGQANKTLTITYKFAGKIHSKTIHVTANVI